VRNHSSKASGEKKQIPSIGEKKRVVSVTQRPTQEEGFNTGTIRDGERVWKQRRAWQRQAKGGKGGLVG